MALFNVSIRVEDADGDSQTFVVPVPRGTLTLAQITSYAQQLVSLIDDIISGQITGISVCIGIELPGGIKSSPLAFSEVQKGANLSFAATGTVYRHTIRIPSVQPALFIGDALDVEDTAVALVIAALVSGLSAGGTTVQPSNFYEMDISGLLDAQKSFRKP